MVRHTAAQRSRPLRQGPETVPANKHMHCLRRITPLCRFIILLVLICCPGIRLEASAAEPMRVVCGFDREFPPFTYEEAGGEPTGFEIELLQAVFHGTDATLLFRPLQWERTGLELSSGTITLTVGMVRTPQRAKLYLFSDRPTFPLQIRLFTKTYNRFPSATLLRGQAVSVEQGSYQHRLLERFGGINIKPYPGRPDGLRALYRDEVAAYCAPVQTTYYYINKLEYGAITTVGTPLGTTEMRIAVNRDRGDVLRLVNEGMERVAASGEYDRLYRKWFVRELSEQERSVMLATAKQAAVPAYVPYGNKGQGAAVLTATGKVYSGCTVENADLSLSTSALRAAVARAIADGEYELRAAVVVDAQGAPLAPTPEDLQVLSEFDRGVLVLQATDKGGAATNMVVELLPNPLVRAIGPTQTE